MIRNIINSAIVVNPGQFTLNNSIMKKLFFIAIMLVTTAVTFTACSVNDHEKTTQLAKDEIYTCNMHNEIMSDHPGDCPKCGMKLVKQKMTGMQMKMTKEGNYVMPKE